MKKNQLFFRIVRKAQKNITIVIPFLNSDETLRYGPPEVNTIKISGLFMKQIQINPLIKEKTDSIFLKSLRPGACTKGRTRAQENSESSFLCKYIDCCLISLIIVVVSFIWLLILYRSACLKQYHVYITVPWKKRTDKFLRKSEFEFLKLAHHKFSQNSYNIIQFTRLLTKVGWQKINRDGFFWYPAKTNAEQILKYRYNLNAYSTFQKV